MKKTMKLALIAFALTAFTACGNQDNTTAGDNITDQVGTDAATDIEADTAITLDPDTTLYHDMTL